MNFSQSWRGLLPLAPMVVAAVALVCPPAINAQDSDPTPARRETARLFAKQCASCHVLPDASLPTDRAWLGRVMETA